MNYGNLFKTIREGKNISISHLSKVSGISKSQISRFENNKSEISFTKLISLISYLNISLEEFALFIPKNANVDKLKSAMSQIKFWGNHQNYQEIQKKLDGCSIFNENKLNNILIKAILSSSDYSLRPSFHEINYLTDYLFSIDFWTYYEIILLGNTIRFINLNTSFLLTCEMLNGGKKYYTKSLSSKQLVIQLTINCIISCIDNYEFSKATYLMNQIKFMLDDENFFFEKNVFLYVTGYFKIKNNNFNGLKNIKDALTVFRILDYQGTYKNYLNHLKTLSIEQSQLLKFGIDIFK